MFYRNFNGIRLWLALRVEGGKSLYPTGNSLDRTLLTFKVFPDHRFPNQSDMESITCIPHQSFSSNAFDSNVICCLLEVGSLYLVAANAIDNRRQNITVVAAPAALYTSLHGSSNFQNTLQILRIRRQLNRFSTTYSSS